MSKTILVTGAAGYIGSHVVPALAGLGHKVVAVDSRAVEFDPCATSVQADFEEVEDKVFRLHGLPDVCLHLAWRNGFDHGDPSHIDALAAHLDFLRKMARAGVKQIAVLGTMHEVGYWEGEIEEKTPTNPQSLYGIAKNALRQAAGIELGKLGVTLQWLRAFYIVGDDRRNKSLFSKIISWEEEGRETFPFNSGKNKYDFIDVSELAKQIAAAVSQAEIAGVINCCSGKAVSLGEQVETFLRVQGFRIRPDYGVFADRPYDSPFTWGNTDKIKQILTARRARVSS